MPDKSEPSERSSSQSGKRRHSRHDKSNSKDVISSSSSSSPSYPKDSQKESGTQPDELKTVKVREIWVGNLPIEINEQILHKTFFIYGEISRIDIHTRKCYAFIRYKLCSSASRAYEKAKNMNLGGRVIRVSFSDSGKRREIIGDEPGYELSEKTCKLLHVSLNKNSIIGNESTIRDVFSKYGTVKYVQTKSCLGFRPSIYIEYSKCEEAEKAVQELNNERNFESRKLLGDPFCDINYYFKKKIYPNDGLNNMSNVNMTMNNNPNTQNMPEGTMNVLGMRGMPGAQKIPNQMMMYPMGMMNQMCK